MIYRLLQFDYAEFPVLTKGNLTRRNQKDHIILLVKR